VDVSGRRGIGGAFQIRRPGAGPGPHCDLLLVTRPGIEADVDDLIVRMGDVNVRPAAGGGLLVAGGGAGGAAVASGAEFGGGGGSAQFAPPAAVAQLRVVGGELGQYAELRGGAVLARRNHATAAPGWENAPLVAIISLTGRICGVTVRISWAL
jgi:hypothetical protein